MTAWIHRDRLSPPFIEGADDIPAVGELSGRFSMSGWRFTLERGRRGDFA